MNTSFGETLRAAREAKGLTTSQIASKTRMLVQIVEEMENEDFHRIAAPIYGRGFVKLYAECVGLDPLPLVKEFMDIYEGRRAPIVRTREVPVQAPPPPAPEPQPVEAPPPVSVPFTPPPAPEPVPEPVPEPPPVTVPPPPAPDAPPPAEPPPPEPVQETPPVVRGLELFDQPQKPAPAAPAPAASQPPASHTADIFSDSPYLTPESSFGGEGPSAAERFRKSLSSVSHGVIQSVREIPRSVWRITLLIITALVILALLAWGCIKLYQATSITPAHQPQEVATNDPKAPPKAPKNINAPKDPKDLKGSKDNKTTANSKPSGRPAPAALQAAGKPASKPASKPAKRQPLRSTGQKVPTLYAD